jgi:hypothetical protein
MTQSLSEGPLVDFFCGCHRSVEAVRLDFLHDMVSSDELLNQRSWSSPAPAVAHEFGPMLGSLGFR